MSEKVVNFSTLKRKEVKVLIYTDNKNGEIITIYNTEDNKDKIKELQEKLENPILIYNPTNEQKLEMQKIIGQIGKKTFNDNKELIIEAKDLVLKFLPLCSNVILDLDEEKDSELIKEIVNDPSDEFNAIINEVKNITKQVSIEYIKAIKEFSSLPKEQLEKILKEAKPELSEKEKRKLELEEELRKINEESNIETENNK